MSSLRDILKYYGQNQWMLGVLVLCCVAVLFWTWKTRTSGMVRMCAILVLPSTLLLVLLLNPVSTHFAVALFHDTQVQRFLWIVPMTLIIAICIVLVLSRLRKGYMRAAVFTLVCCAVLFYANGFTRLRTTWQVHTDNWYKGPQVVVELCDDILQDDCERKTAVFPSPLNLWVRQYSGEIQLPFAWNTKEDTPEAEALYDLYGEVGTDPVDLDELARLAKEGDYTYIVLAEQGNYTGSLVENGYEEISRVHMYPERGDSAYYQAYILYRRE